jgi:transketolase
MTLAATGGIVGTALEAAEMLADQGIECRVISVHTLKPLDTATLVQATRETGGILSIEEHTVSGGLGGAIAETLLEAGEIPESFYRIGLRDTFSSVVGSQTYLRSRYGMDADSVVATVKELVHPEPAALPTASIEDSRDEGLQPADASIHGRRE